jgi:signal transduction histidine kinase
MSVLETSKELSMNELTFKRAEPVESLFDDAVAQCAHLLREGILQIDIAEGAGAIVLCDKKMLTQVFVNVIRNAVEAIGERLTKGNGFVKIRASRTENNYIALSVEDNGIGMEPTVKDDVFRFRFTTKRDGTGVGLYLSKMILKLHEGNIAVESEAGVGTTIRMLLPVHVPEHGRLRSAS